MQKRLVSFLEINFARTMFPISTPHFGAGFSFLFLLSQVVELFSFCALLRRRFVGFDCFKFLVVCVVLSLKESRRPLRVFYKAFMTVCGDKEEIWGNDCGNGRGGKKPLFKF